MMHRPRELGARIEQIRKTVGLSAYAVAKAAGLNINYVRLIERGMRRPGIGALSAIAAVLGLDAVAVSELRRLAGIDPDPAAEPEAQDARRKAWRPLAYVLVNHVLLPRLELERALTRKRPLTHNDKELMRLAASAPDIASFVKNAADAPAPSRGLAKLLEETFRSALPGDIERINRHVKADAFSRDPWGFGDSWATPYRWNTKWAVVSLLRSENRPQRTDDVLLEYLHRFSFDYNFAVCLFPAIYWHACRSWPFEKVQMREARRSPESQRLIYDSVEAGLTLDGLDQVLLGRGEIGTEIASKPAVRPSPEETDEPPGADRVQLVIFAGDRTVKIIGPRPPTDALFDHLDRCEFLGRFPIIQVDRAGFAELARLFNLESWAAWREFWKARAGRSADTERPPLSAERFASVLRWFRESDSEVDTVQTIDSQLGRTLVEETAAGMAAIVGRRDWAGVANAARAAGIGASWQRIVDALAKRARGPLTSRRERSRPAGKPGT